MGLFDTGDVRLENADIDCEPQNEYVSEETVAKIDDVLDGGEKVHFLAREAGGGVTIQGATEDEEKKVASGGHIRTAATDRRVVSKIPNLIGSEEISIPYDSISTVDLKSGLVRTRLSLQTDMKTYGIEIGHLNDDECKRMSRFIREKVSEANQQSAAGSDSTADPLDKLERLRDLKDEGVISDEEFDEKKAELLDQI